MTILTQTRRSLNFQGRSFLAYVISPSSPIENWLRDLDDWVTRTPDFFASKPIILDCSKIQVSRNDFRNLLARLQTRQFRLISIEGVDSNWIPEGLEPLAGGRHRDEIDALKSQAGDNDAKNSTAGGDVNSLMLNSPVRSGQSIFFPNGDVSVTGHVASGAEIIAGGSIHIYGALRGRAIAGSNADTNARIFCSKFEAELVVIGGFYKSAQDIDPELFGGPVQIWLQDNLILLKEME